MRNPLEMFASYRRPMTHSVSRLLDIPPLTAAAAFESVPTEPGVRLDVCGDQVQLRGHSAEAVMELALRMQEWVDAWTDGAVRDVFVHPVLRSRQAPPRP